MVISANGHAAKLGLRADYIFCKDHTHTETKESMEALLRPLGVPIVSRQYWADYRAPQWPVQGNSGQNGLALGALLGCAPIIGLGFDCYQGATYFHAPDVKNISQGKHEGHWNSRYQRMSVRLTGAAIRMIDGPLARVLPRYDPAERFERVIIPAVLQQYADMRIYRVRALRPFPLRCSMEAEVPAGRVIALSAFEAAYHLREGDVVEVDNPYSAVVTSSPQATAPRGAPLIAR